MSPRRWPPRGSSPAPAPPPICRLSSAGDDPCAGGAAHAGPTRASASSHSRATSLSSTANGRAVRLRAGVSAAVRARCRAVRSRGRGVAANVRSLPEAWTMARFVTHRHRHAGCGAGTGPAECGAAHLVPGRRGTRGAVPGIVSHDPVVTGRIGHGSRAQRSISIVAAQTDVRTIVQVWDQRGCTRRGRRRDRVCLTPERSSGNPSGMHVPARSAAYRRHVDLRRQASALCPATV
ncbi:hypothetical protein ACFPM0_34160 [Pseudonocardia sulfidoxydans]|uniref:hypothetical protein n=1 Tax=Pseudonocardia sulfidoxydans TaxID=54011 RepID=UPI003607FDEF